MLIDSRYFTSYGSNSALYSRGQGPVQYKDRLSMYGTSITTIRRSWDRLIFKPGIRTLVRRHLYTEASNPHSVATSRFKPSLSFLIPNVFANSYACSLKGHCERSRFEKTLYLHIWESAGWPKFRGAYKVPNSYPRNSVLAWGCYQ